MKPTKQSIELAHQIVVMIKANENAGVRLDIENWIAQLIEENVMQRIAEDESDSPLDDI